MKRTYLVVIISAFLIALLAFSYSYVQSQKASAKLAHAVSELKNIEFTSALQNIPDNNLERKLSQARNELVIAASRVSSIKGTIAKSTIAKSTIAKSTIAGISRSGVAGKREAIGSIKQAMSKLAQVEFESKKMLQANSEFLVELTTLQAQYAAKIASIEERISAGVGDALCRSWGRPLAGVGDAL